MRQAPTLLGIAQEPPVEAGSLLLFAAAAFLTARGWLVGCGSRIGCDMVAYRRHEYSEDGSPAAAAAPPKPRQHADLGVLVWPDGGTSDRGKASIRTRSLQARLRAAHHARKSLLLLKVAAETPFSCRPGVTIERDKLASLLKGVTVECVLLGRAVPAVVRWAACRATGGSLGVGTGAVDGDGAAREDEGGRLEDSSGATEAMALPSAPATRGEPLTESGLKPAEGGLKPAGSGALKAGGGVEGQGEGGGEGEGEGGSGASPSGPFIG